MPVRHQRSIGPDRKGSGSDDVLAKIHEDLCHSPPIPGLDSVIVQVCRQLVADQCSLGFLKLDPEGLDLLRISGTLGGLKITTYGFQRPPRFQQRLVESLDPPLESP